MCKIAVKPSLLHAGHLAFGAGWRAASHRHSFTEILILLAGQIAIRGERGYGRELDAGEAIIYPQEMAHAETSRTARVEMICLAGRLPWREITAVTDERGRLRTIGRWIAEECASAYPQRRESAGALFTALCAEIARLLSHREPDAFAEIRRFMRIRLQEPHRVRDLARHCGMSPCYFIRRYRAVAGRSPMADLQQMRIAAACDLLLTTDWPLKRIAAETGFCDEYYFSRIFKRQMRLTPGAFRRRAEGKK